MRGFFKWLEAKSQVMPPIDKERFSELGGLEGPFRFRSGKVLYYDPKEGKYYDRETDMYLDNDEMMHHLYRNNGS